MPQPLVLIVQDQPLLMMAMADYAEEAGCGVVEATTVAQAIGILETRADIRIVFSDMDMRGSPEGLMLAQAIRRRWPPIELILTSAQLRPQDADIPERGLYVAKPFERRKVLGALRQLAA